MENYKQLLDSNNYQVAINGQPETDVKVDLFTLCCEVWPLGFITYGGPLAHIGLFQQKFVNKLKWVDKDEFTELTTICQSVPGPTSTQLLISIATLSTNSLLGGFLAFLLFFAPSFIVLSLAGMYLSDYRVEGAVFQLLAGFKCAAVAVVLQAFWGLSKKYREANDSIALFCTCALIYLFSPTRISNSYSRLYLLYSNYHLKVLTMLGLFVISVVYCFYFKPIPVSTEYKSTPKIIKSSVMGKNSAYAFFGLVILCSLLKETASSPVIKEMAIFYRIGSVIIGGGHVILPMMWTQFSGLNYMTEDNYWNGFSLVSCMPGPMFNLAAYIGALINGFFGAVVCCFALYLPSFLTIWAVIPYWQEYRTNSRVQQIIYGLCCASIGLILAAVAMLWVNACFRPANILATILSTLVSALSFYCVQFRKIQIPFVIFGAGILYTSLSAMLRF